MEFKVREVEGNPQKSNQELERELLKSKELESQTPPPPVEEVELSEDKVLEFIEKKHGKKFSKIEELFQPAAADPEKLPEDVEAFLKYKKETGRSLNDFIMINRDLDKLDPDAVLKDFYSSKNPGLTEDEIQFMVNENKADDDIDDENTIKRKSIQRKKELEQAKGYLREQSEKFKAPLESREPAMNEEQKREFQAFQEYIAKSKTETEAIQRKSEWFQKKTDEVFSNQFKGFEFKIAEDKSAVFNPGDTQTLKQNQSQISNFLKKFTNPDGLIEDATGYHKALSVAMNADQFAKHFYELGVAEAVESQSKKDKNINFGMRQTPQTFNKGGLKIREVSEGGNGKLVIKST